MQNQINIPQKSVIVPAIRFSHQVNANTLPTHRYNDFVRLPNANRYFYQTAKRFRFHSLNSKTINMVYESYKAESVATLKAKFDSLVNHWKRETHHFSVIARRYENPAYKAILAMRESAISLILDELRRNPDRWFSALEKLTGANPAKNAVNFYEAVDRWVAWGIANEYIS